MLPFQQRKPTCIVKCEVKPLYGSPPSERTTEQKLQNGIVCINKPSGPTSHQVSEWVKNMTGTSSAGHSGTLDPAVTGVLPVCLGKATRIVQAIHEAGKEYVCYMRVHQPTPEKQIQEVLKTFVGTISQLPPVKSAVKREIRSRDIFYLTPLEILGQDVLYVVGCESGTYIRKLCTDIGVSLGCGAHMQQLIRTKVATFTDEHMVSLHTLVDAMAFYKEQDPKLLNSILYPVEAGVAHLKKIWILNSSVARICNGAALTVSDVARLHSDIQPEDMVAIMSAQDELVCLAQTKLSSKDVLAAKRGIVAITLRVLMDAGLYPKDAKNI